MYSYEQNGDGQVSPDLLYGQNEDGGWPGQSRRCALWTEWGWTVARTVLMCSMGRMGMEGGQDSPDVLYG
jgi:hypothetical protein